MKKNHYSKIFNCHGYVKNGYFIGNANAFQERLKHYAEIKASRAWGWKQDYNNRPEIALYKVPTFEYKMDDKIFKSNVIYIDYSKNEIFVANESYSEAKRNYIINDNLGKGFKFI